MRHYCDALCELIVLLRWVQHLPYLLQLDLSSDRATLAHRSGPPRPASPRRPLTRRCAQAGHSQGGSSPSAQTKTRRVFSAIRSDTSTTSVRPQSAHACLFIYVSFVLWPSAPSSLLLLRCSSL